MPNRFLIIVTMLTVTFTVGVVCFAFSDIGGGGEHPQLKKIQSTAKHYWRQAKESTLEHAAPILSTFGVNVDTGKISAEDSEVSKYLEDASSTVNSAIKSITQ